MTHKKPPLRKENAGYGKRHPPPTSVGWKRNEIEDLGTVTLARGEHVIHCLTVIGQIEGHTESRRRAKDHEV